MKDCTPAVSLCAGGERKLCEVLQLACLEPELAILDEVDSGGG